MHGSQAFVILYYYINVNNLETYYYDIITRFAYTTLLIW